MAEVVKETGVKETGAEEMFGSNASPEVNTLPVSPKNLPLLAPIRG